MGQMILNLVQSHSQLIAGAVLGAVLSNPGTCAVLLFQGVTKIPGVGAWIAANPDKAKAWADGFDKAIDTCVDKYAAAAKPAPSAAPSGASQV